MNWLPQPPECADTLALHNVTCIAALRDFIHSCHDKLFPVSQQIVRSSTRMLCPQLQALSAGIECRWSDASTKPDLASSWKVRTSAAQLCSHFHVFSWHPWPCWLELALHISMASETLRPLCRLHTSTRMALRFLKSSLGCPMLSSHCTERQGLLALPSKHQGTLSCWALIWAVSDTNHPCADGNLKAVIVTGQRLCRSKGPLGAASRSRHSPVAQ